MRILRGKTSFRPLVGQPLFLARGAIAAAAVALLGVYAVAGSIQAGGGALPRVDLHTIGYVATVILNGAIEPAGELSLRD